MASLGRSFMSSYLSRGRRPGIPGSAKSNSSEALSQPSSTSSSPLSSRSEDQQQLVLSRAASPTPPAEMVPSHRQSGKPPLAPLTTLQDPDNPLLLPGGSNTNNNSAQFTADGARLSRSKPITIELPEVRNPSTASVYTPDPPLSARGDIPGGYFPLHEEKARVHRPHPFYSDVNSVRDQSTGQATESGSPERLQIPGAMSDSRPRPAVPASPAFPAEDLRANTPVSSYLPMGAQGTPLPMGKYYPSNYERSRPGGSSAGQSLKLPTAAQTQTAYKSDSQVPQYRVPASHARSDSEARRRLQQYQRDMIAQATMAANQILGGVGRKAGSNLAASSPMRTIPQLGASVTTQKPRTPDLLPLGSPGPVTPMDLEGGGGGGPDGGYLTRGRPVSGPDASREADAIARAIRSEEERRRREDATSPAVELGPGTF